MRRPIRLKWHKLRRHKGDPPFQRANLEAGLRAGAALEVDLVATADGHFLCLHDTTLDRETTGSGLVAAARRAEVERLRQRDNDGAVLNEPPLFLDEVVGAVLRHGGEASGRVQLDLKEPLANLGGETVRCFAATLGAAAPAFTLSGCDGGAVRLLREAAPSLRAGFDPLDFYTPQLPRGAAAFKALAARTIAEAPEAVIYYLEADLVLAGLESGVNLVELVGQHGAEIDAWTVDADRPDVGEVLRRLVGAGCHQITSNHPIALAHLLAEMAP